MFEKRDKKIMRKRQKSIKFGHRSRGFSLIELMFAIAILLVVILGAIVSFINCMFLNEFNRHLVIAANDAQYALEQIKAQNFSDISTYISGYSAGKFTNLPVENITFPNPVYTSTLDTITVQVSWNERQGTKNFSITTRFAQ